MKFFRRDNTIGYSDEEIAEMNREMERVLKGFKEGTKEYWDAVKRYVESIGGSHVQFGEDQGNGH